jgi:hypothetical protein
MSPARALAILSVDPDAGRPPSDLRRKTMKGYTPIVRRTYRGKERKPRWARRVKGPVRVAATVDANGVVKT